MPNMVNFPLLKKEIRMKYNRWLTPGNGREKVRMGENGLETESGIPQAYPFPLSAFRTPTYGSVSDLWGGSCLHTKESTPYAKHTGNENEKQKFDKLLSLSRNPWPAWQAFEREGEGN